MRRQTLLPAALFLLALPACGGGGSYYFSSNPPDGGEQSNPDLARGNGNPGRDLGSGNQGGGGRDMAANTGGSAPACTASSSVGVPVSGRPTYDERVALYATDRSRADPAAINWPSYPAVPPLLWNDSLGKSSLAHSVDMRDTPCFQHPSCDGTDPFVRIESYWTGAYSSLGENISAGVSDGQTVVHNWIEEIGAAPGETGHRDNIFSSTFNYVGLGYAAGGTKYQGYWTQDFAGVQSLPSIPRLAAGAHFPKSASAGGPVSFGTVYYDRGGAAPSRVVVVVDGDTSDLSLYAGKSAAGAYQGAVRLAAGCHRYQFRAVTGSQVSCYPGTGTFGVAVGSAGSCADYQQ